VRLSLRRALTREPEPTPILGVVDPPERSAPFLSFLRLLAGLAEVGTDSQLERANRFLFKGVLTERRPFDLHVLVVDAGHAASAPSPLVQLTRDLATAFQAALGEEWALPPLVRSLRSLRMPAVDRPFDGRLAQDWQV
jgi:hypothetical protein